MRAPGGELPEYQRLVYDSGARDQFLVKLTTHIRNWVQGVMLVRLDGDLEQALGQMHTGLPSCEYAVRHQSQLEKAGRAPVVSMDNHFYVKLVGFQPGRFADLAIQIGSARWWCSGVRHHDPSVTMTLRNP